MNQTIMLAGEAMWQPDTRELLVNVFCGGALIPCRISSALLAGSAAGEEVDEAQAQARFETIRFDVEERVATLIEQESFQEDGSLYVDLWC